MKLKIILLFILLNGVLFADIPIPFNYTIVPGINLFPVNNPVLFSTGTISAEVPVLYGFQAGPVYGLSHSSVLGFQTGGVFVLSGGSVTGFQSGGVFAVSGGPVHGVQASGVFNIAAGSMRGLQAGGVFNIADRDVRGFQTAGVFNISDGLKGLQAGGIFNIAGGSVYGFQVAGIFNVAQRLFGTQISVVNVSDHITGVQLGIINVASVSYEAVPLGLINIYSDGIQDVSVWMDDNNRLYQGIETGSRAVYTLIYTGTDRENITETEGRILGGGLGYRLYPGFGAIDMVLGGKTELKDFSSQTWTPEGRFSVSVNIGRLSVTGGVSGDLKIRNYNDDAGYFSKNSGYLIDDNHEVMYSLFFGGKLHLNAY